jgi:hypothetical protein
MAFLKNGWRQASRRQKAVIAVAAFFVLAGIGSLSQPATTLEPDASPNPTVAVTPHLDPTVSQATPTPTPSPAASPSAVSATATPELSPAPSPTAISSPTPTAVPSPTPVEATFSDPIAVGASKVTLKGRDGTYTWSDISFGNELAKFRWTATATASACAVAFSWQPDFGDAISKSLKPARKTSISKSAEVEVYPDESGQFVVESGCPSWSVALTSYAKPPYWNPWGYNFSPGKLIYSPPPDFCLYFDCIPSFGNSPGYVVQCRDLMFSTAGGRQGACSYHGGVNRTLYRH